MKKKVLAIALAVALIAIMVSGSLAYFTANDEVTNTFTVGSVKIDIYENDAATDSDTIPFGKLTPVVNTANPSDDESYLPKVVEVKNTGVNDAYVRVFIAVPTQLAHTYLTLEMNLDGWTQQATVEAEIGGVIYDVLVFDYNTAVAAGEFTAELLKGVYLASDVDLAEDAAGNLQFVRRYNGEIIDESGFVAHTLNANGTYTSSTVNVLVSAQAIQTDGFESGATAALNTGFPAHPWAN